MNEDLAGWDSGGVGTAVVNSAQGLCVVSEVGRGTVNVCVPKRQRVAWPTAASHVTRIPTEMVAEPPWFVHRTDGLPTETELECGPPEAAASRCPGIEMK